MSKAYLSKYTPGSLEKLESFHVWMSKRPEFNTMFLELDHSGVEALMSVDELSPGDGVALNSEVLAVVNNRSGSVLAQQTILKVVIMSLSFALILTAKVRLMHSPVLRD
jgi:hypothetical protein